MTENDSTGFIWQVSDSATPSKAVVKIVSAYKPGIQLGCPECVGVSGTRLIFITAVKSGTETITLKLSKGTD